VNRRRGAEIETTGTATIQADRLRHDLHPLDSSRSLRFLTALVEEDDPQELLGILGEKLDPLERLRRIAGKTECFRRESGSIGGVVAKLCEEGSDRIRRTQSGDVLFVQIQIATVRHAASSPAERLEGQRDRHRCRPPALTKKYGKGTLFPFNSQSDRCDAAQIRRTSSSPSGRARLDAASIGGCVGRARVVHLEGRA